MSEQARICKSCGRENQGHAKFCAQCGAELAPFGMRNFLIAAGLTVLPFAATPIVLVTWTAADSGGGDYDVLGAALLSILAIPVYLLIGGITSAVVWRRNRSAPRASSQAWESGRWREWRRASPRLAHSDRTEVLRLRNWYHMRSLREARARCTALSR